VWSLRLDSEGSVGIDFWGWHGSAGRDGRLQTRFGQSPRAARASIQQQKRTVLFGRGTETSGQKEKLSIPHEAAFF